jgi:hypothetical protein
MLRNWSDGAGHPQATVNSAAVTFRWLQNKRYEFRAGFGGWSAMGPEGRSAGPDFVWAIDVLPRAPVVVSLGGEAGHAHDAFLRQTRFSIGATSNGWEIYGGFASFQSNDIEVHGPVCGLRYWL